MNSMKEHWEGLTLFVDNPEIPIDNNLAECAKRGSAPSGGKIELFLPPKLNESIKTKLKSFG